ncbi:MAG TPA: hypothetical protein VFZ83_16055 [Acidimicrobiia bacterium]|nr:hypothetical protein [Acidimicrobiia bacterium]
MLADGTYDAFIVWVDERDDGAFALQVTITTGPHRGDVVELVAHGFAGRDPFDLVALPCALIVDGGAPRIDW